MTEIPEFANNNALIALLQSKGVVINATSPSSGTSMLVTLLLTFGPVLLIVGLFVWLMRRARRHRRRDDRVRPLAGAAGRAV